MKKKWLSVFAVALVVLFSSNSLAANLDDGVWSYGGHHEIGNWGAFSNYWHPTEKHWSQVVRHSDSESDKGYADADKTSKAFLNTSIGEKVSFYRGF